MNIKSRLQRLERELPHTCSTCGWSAGEVARIVIHWPAPGEPPGQSEYCSECGWPTRIVVRWPDDWYQPDGSTSWLEVEP
jgi:ribosomal protein L37E